MTTSGILVSICIQALVAAFVTHPAHGANPVVSSVLLVKASDGSDPEAYCVLYVPAIKDIAKREADAEYLPLLNVMNDTECDYERRSFEGKVVLMERCDNTSNDDIIQKAKSVKAAAIVMSYNEKRPIMETSTYIKKLDIMVAFAKNSTGRKIARYEEKHANSTVMAKLFTRATALDWSFVIIWLIAVGTVTMGAYWSGIAQCGLYGITVHSILMTRPSTFSVDVRYKQTANQPVKTNKPRRISRALRRPSEPDRKPRNSSVSVGVPLDHSDFTESMNEMEEEFSVAVSPKLIVMFVMHMSVMLLVLYYFYRYLVHFMVIMFAMASAVALVSCLEPLVSRINIGTSQVPKQLAACCQTRMELRQVALLAFGMSVAAAWFLLRRNDTFGWILQDLLGVAFCINMLKSFHLPNLKLLSLLLTLLLIYDVFFVFITPFLRANRESVMVEVAKGSGVKEVLPMVIKFPRIYRSIYSKCFQMKFSILGLGDILAPGMLVSYCHTFDLFALGRRFYFYIACVSYGMGMVTTFIALELMRNAQPALLYLVPFTIIPTVTTAWFKGHLSAIWNGIKLRENGRKDGGDNDTEIPTPPPGPGGRQATGGNSAADFTTDKAEGANTGTRGRQRHRPKSKNPEDQGDEPGSSKGSNLPVHEGSSINGGDGHGATDNDEFAASPQGTASPSCAAGEAERVRAGAHSTAVFACDVCPATDVVPASHKRVPMHLGYNTWEDRLSRFVLSHQRKNGLRRDTANTHATSPSTA